MENFLYISQGAADDMAVLGQALALARNNDTSLTVLLVCPQIPQALAQYRGVIEESIKQNFQEVMQAAEVQFSLTGLSTTVNTALLEGPIPAVRIIRHVMQHHHGLVIKAVEAREDNGGLRSIDMELLRKCPAPVWLHRPGSGLREGARLAVAIDPEYDTPEARALSLRMLGVARELAGTIKGELHVVSCWDFPFEDYLRHSVRSDIDGNELTREVLQARDLHYATLQELLQEAGIGKDGKVHHLRGVPDTRIPRFINEQAIGLLIMGTLARTGIPGFVIGNTAENIVQNLSCSLLAFKPEGFVSPVPME